MSDVAAPGGWSPERSAAGGHNPYLIAFVVSIAGILPLLHQRPEQPLGAIQPA